VLRIELDEPYHVTYKVGYLNLVRNTTSTVGISSSVASGSATAQDGGASSSTITGSSEADFWRELIVNLRQIITNTGRLSGLAAPPAQQLQQVIANISTTSTPTQTTDTATLTQSEQLANLLSALGSGTPPTASTAAAGGQQPAGNATGTPVQTAAQARDADSFFTVNRQAGLVSVFGTQREHKAVAAYLEKLHTSVTSQVLIEAKILEVTLDDEFRFGIDWATLFDGRANAAAPFNTTTTPSVQTPSFSQLINAPGGAVLATANVLTLAGGTPNLNGWPTWSKHSVPCGHCRARA
jgi:general secretion pathway protein D